MRKIWIDFQCDAFRSPLRGKIPVHFEVPHSDPEYFPQYYYALSIWARWSLSL